MTINLKGETIRVAANQVSVIGDIIFTFQALWFFLKHKPYIFANYYQNPPKKLHSVEGFEGKMIEVLSDCMNFTIEIIDCGFKWGHLSLRGTWDGCVGMVLDEVNMN